MSVAEIIALQDELNRLARENRDDGIKEEESLQAASNIEDETGTYTLVNAVPLW
jgi:hypothetical protein